MRRVRFIVDGKVPCAVCKKQKSTTDFHKSKASPIGVCYVCKPCTAERAAEWYKANIEKAPHHWKVAQRNRKVKALSFYSNGAPVCACCGITELAFLTIDHINGNGAAHRRSIGRVNFYAWLIRNEYPDGFQVLCYNCNCAKRDGAECPHKR